MGKHPIKELGDQLSKERLMQSLERGNLHQVNFVKGDREDKMFIEANPQFKTLNIYNGELKKVFQEHERKELQADKAKEPSGEKNKNKKTIRRIRSMMTLSIKVKGLTLVKG